MGRDVLPGGGCLIFDNCILRRKRNVGGEALAGLEGPKGVLSSERDFGGHVSRESYAFFFIANWLAFWVGWFCDDGLRFWRGPAGCLSVWRKIGVMFSSIQA